MSSNLQSSSAAPRDMGHPHQARGRADQTGSGRGGSIHRRRRGRGANTIGGIGGGGPPPGVSLREHASASIIPLQRRHRIYLPLDNPQPRRVPSVETSPEAQDRDGSVKTTEGQEFAVQTPLKDVDEDNQAPGLAGDATDDIRPRSTYIQRFRRPCGGSASRSEVAPLPEMNSSVPAMARQPQDHNDLLLTFDDGRKTGQADLGDLIDFGED
ncbi:MAG: hypothetical protein Q9196_003101 [Gyalolechia fulgens]